MKKLKDYKAPAGHLIDSRETKLYSFEDNRNDLIKVCAGEHGKILGHTDDQFWTHSIPEQLLSVLDSFDSRASYLVAKTYIDSIAIRNPHLMKEINESI